MRRFMIMSAIVCIVTACTGSPTPDPVSIQQAVQATLRAFPTATPIIVEVTRVATVEPTPTVTNTAIPTAQPISEPPIIPVGWKNYRSVGGVSFAYPPTMGLVGETPEFAEFATSNGRTLRVYSDSLETIQPLENLTQVGDRLRQLKKAIVQAVPAGVKWMGQDLEQGVLDAPNSPAYIWYSESALMWRGFGSYATNGERTAIITLGVGRNESLGSNPQLIDDMLAMLTDVVRSVEF